LMLATTLLGPGETSLDDLWQHSSQMGELAELLEFLDGRLDHKVMALPPHREVPLAIHASYRLTEIMSAFGDVRDGRLYIPREGEYFHEPTRCNLLFVTLQKDEEDYSPTTMYHDYALGPSRFHWQSQIGTRPTDKKGRRHIEHVEQGVTPLLFVRERRLDDRNERVAYVYLGPVTLLTYSGERPINVEWELAHHMPAEVLRMASVVA